MYYYIFNSFVLAVAMKPHKIVSTHKKLTDSGYKSTWLSLCYALFEREVKIGISLILNWVVSTVIGGHSCSNNLVFHVPTSI